TFQPAAPLKLGHLATTLVSGMFQAINLGDRIIRGAATRISTAYDELGNVVDKDSPLAVELRESFHTVIYEMARNGHYRVLRKPEELEQLLAEYIDLMQLMVLDQFTPLYNGDPTEAEWRKLDPMIPHKRLPGRQSAGLLLAQKHATVASARVLKKYRDATWLIGDPGTGK